MRSGEKRCPVSVWGYLSPRSDCIRLLQSSNFFCYWFYCTLEVTKLNLISTVVDIPTVRTRVRSLALGELCPNTGGKNQLQPPTYLISSRASNNMAQWIRIHPPMQETQVHSLIREDPRCCGADEPVCHNYQACVLEPGRCNCWGNHWNLCAFESMLHKRSPCNEKPLHRN